MDRRGAVIPPGKRSWDLWPAAPSPAILPELVGQHGEGGAPGGREYPCHGSQYQMHARLIHPLRNKGGGVRPIAVRDTLRRLVAKGLLVFAKPAKLNYFFLSKLPPTTRFICNLTLFATMCLQNPRNQRHRPGLQQTFRRRSLLSTEFDTPKSKVCSRYNHCAL